MKGTSIKCPYCGHGKNVVRRTMRLTVGGTVHVRRYRRCENQKCKMSFRTKEVLDEDTSTNLKRTESDIVDDKTDN